MNEGEGAFAEGPRQLAEEPPALGHLLGITIGHFELIAGPKDGPLGAAGKAFRVIEGALVVVAEDRLVEAENAVDAFPRVRTVADNIAQAVNTIDAFAGDVRQDGLKGLQIGVDIADDGAFHRMMCMEQAERDVQGQPQNPRLRFGLVRYRPDIRRSPRALSRSGTA